MRLTGARLTMPSMNSLKGSKSSTRVASLSQICGRAISEPRCVVSFLLSDSRLFRYPFFSFCVFAFSFCLTHMFYPSTPSLHPSHNTAHNNDTTTTLQQNRHNLLRGAKTASTSSSRLGPTRSKSTRALDVPRAQEIFQMTTRKRKNRPCLSPWLSPAHRRKAKS